MTIQAFGVIFLALTAGSAAAPASTDERPLVLQRTPRAGEREVHAFVLDRKLVAQRLVTRSGRDEQLSQDEIDVGGRVSLRIVDSIRAVEGGRATVFQRLLEEASARVDVSIASPGSKPRTQLLEATSPLTGSAVLFRWIPARGEYGRLYDQVETSEEFLPRLEPSIDLAFLLPSGPVAVGQAWSPDVARLARAFSLGGYLPLRFGRGSEPLFARTTALGVGGPLQHLLDGTITGRLEARLVGVAGDVAKIALVLDVRAETDQAGANREMLTPTERYDGLTVESARGTWSFRGEGELLWNVRAGRAERLSLSGAEEVRLGLAIEGPQGPAGSDLALAGGLKLSIDVSAGPSAR